MPEFLGDLLLELQEAGQALREYEDMLKNSPNRFHALSEVARAAEILEDHDKAYSFYSHLLLSRNQAEGDRVELARAKTYVSKGSK